MYWLFFGKDKNIKLITWLPMSKNQQRLIFLIHIMYNLWNWEFLA